MDNITIRLAQQKDCQEISRLIKELSVFENLEDQVTIGPTELAMDGFSENPFYKCLVAEYTGKDRQLLVGYLLFYYTYSTFQVPSRSAFVDDVYVNPDFRNRGIGTCLWKTTAKMVVDAGCARLDFVIPKWNAYAINFFSKMGACNLTDKEQWNIWRLKKEHLNKIVNS